MNTDEIIACLKASERVLRARGVRHAALFGSSARGTARADSDIDILIDIEPDAVTDVYAYVDLGILSRRCFPPRSTL